MVSPWHDIPLYDRTEDRTNQTFNMVVEIPRFTQVTEIDRKLSKDLIFRPSLKLIERVV